MADRSSYGLAPRLDIEQLLLEAQHRWLRPAEICEILRNYHKFQISPEPPDRPPSGSLFLFDRKVLRYFRKDGHIWRKKKDGKTVKEAHEKLKVGSIDVLHCYYAHGEENESFQRRSYWMLEPELMHIVFVHYLEVKGSRTVGGVRETSDASSFQQGSPSTSSGSISHMKTHADSPSPTSTLYSDADSEELASTTFSSSPQVGSASPFNKIDPAYSNPYSLHSLPGRTSIPGTDNISNFHGSKVRDTDHSASVVEPQETFDSASWEVGMDRHMSAYPSASSSLPSVQHNSSGVLLEQVNMIKRKPVASDNVGREDLENLFPSQSNWQILFGDNSLDFSKWPLDTSANLEYAYDPRFIEQRTFDHGGPQPFTILNLPTEQLIQEDSKMQAIHAVPVSGVQLNSEDDVNVQGNAGYSFPLKKSLLEGEESLKKVDSFSRWVAKELVEVDDLQMQSSSGLSWNSVECGTVADESSLSPSLSQDQLFSIIDFSPKWTYTDLEMKVLILGTFLGSQQEVGRGNWSCMFGEVEVPAEAIADGILCCYAPPHNVGQVPFYVTQSNRLACSEVREFDYRDGVSHDLKMQDIYGATSGEALLCLRLDKLLSLKSSPSDISFADTKEKRDLICRIILLKEEEESYHSIEAAHYQDLPLQECKKQFLQKLMKEKLYSWLLHKVVEDGKGPSVLDENGQGVLHLGAALGYDWAIKPTITAGVSINFRDVSGWTSLHWAALYGREQTVAVLISLGAAPGALTVPSSEFPLGRTAADLASSSGHKGISGFLAESSLTNHLSTLTVNESNEEVTKVSGAKAIQTVSERTATPLYGGHSVQDELCLRDSLNAVCNATQAASRIQQVYEKQKLGEKQLGEYDDDVLDEHAVSILVGKKLRPVKGDGVVHAAATHIQKKFRGWKKRREFLIIRQRIVKIQAHIRGHQVRKQYKTIIWSVGILEKVILRWRRKGSGLRGFRRDALTKDADPQMSSKEDDYDFLKEGRKQTEERLEKALTRVKSMVQYPEGRAQYRRLLTVVEGIRETKACDMVLTPKEETENGDEELPDLDSLLDDETFMSIAFE